MHSKGLVICSLLACLSAPSFAGQLLVNGGFETGTTAGWVAVTGQGPEPDGGITSREAHSGTYSFAAFGGDFVSPTFAPVAVSDIKELSFWAKRYFGVFSYVGFEYSDGTTSRALPSNMFTNDWTHFNVTSDLVAAKSLVGVKIYGTSPGPSYLDDFKLVATVPEPDAGVMMVAGLCVLGASVRRRQRKPASAPHHLDECLA